MTAEQPARTNAAEDSPAAKADKNGVGEDAVSVERAAEEPSTETAVSGGASEKSDTSAKPEAPLPLPEGTTVLHVGDSFAGALGPPLKRLFHERGVRGILEQETASYIPNWSSGDKLQKLLWRHQPDLVLITLGANELEIVEPEQRVRNIRRIVELIGERPCVWIATPLWAGPKNGLMDIIRENVAPCLYMDTNALIDEMARVSDGIHPTLSAREHWAQVVIDWLQVRRRPVDQQPWALVEQNPPRADQPEKP